MNIKEMLQKKEQLEARVEQMLEEFSRETELPFSNLELLRNEIHGNYANKRDSIKAYQYHVKLEVTF